MSDSELLAILLGSGNDRESAVELARRILREAGNDLHKLGRFDANDLIKNFRGMGRAKAATLLAALELGRRRREVEGADRKKIGSSKEAYEVFYPIFADLPYEEMWVLLLDRANKVIAPVQVSKGGISATVVDVRLILREAITRYASAIVVGHNHPSGNCAPSGNDRQITYKIKEAARLMEIEFHDHLIVGNDTFYSFADDGAL